MVILFLNIAVVWPLGPGRCLKLCKRILNWREKQNHKWRFIQT